MAATKKAKKKTKKKGNKKARPRTRRKAPPPAPIDRRPEQLPPVLQRLSVDIPNAEMEELRDLVVYVQKHHDHMASLRSIGQRFVRDGIAKMKKELGITTIPSRGTKTLPLGRKVS